MRQMRADAEIELAEDERASWRRSRGQGARRKPLPCVRGSFCSRPTVLRQRRSPKSLESRSRRCASGARGMWKTDCLDCAMNRGRVGRDLWTISEWRTC